MSVIEDKVEERCEMRVLPTEDSVGMTLPSVKLTDEQEKIFRQLYPQPLGVPCDVCGTLNGIHLMSCRLRSLVSPEQEFAAAFKLPTPVGEYGAHLVNDGDGYYDEMGGSPAYSEEQVRDAIARALVQWEKQKCQTE